MVSSTKNISEPDEVPTPPPVAQEPVVEAPVAPKTDVKAKAVKVTPPEEVVAVEETPAPPASHPDFPTRDEQIFRSEAIRLG